MKTPLGEFRRGFRLCKLVAALLIFTTGLPAEDFKISQEGLGPVSLHTTMTFEGKGERLVATARNDSSETIPYVRLCISGDAKVACLFTVWNTEPWKPGAELNWNVANAVKADSLSHQVWVQSTIDPAAVKPAPLKPMKPMPPPPKPTVTITVVNTDETPRSIAWAVPGSPATSSTSCSGSATAIGSGGIATASGTSNCETVSNPGRVPSVQSLSIPQANVRATMPGGRQIRIWCQAGFRRCASLEPGNYDAEIDGNTLWVTSFKLDGKPLRIKYQYVGGW